MIHVRTSALLIVAALTACGGGVSTTPIGSSEFGPRPTPTPTASAPGLPGVLQASPAALAFTSVTAAAQTVTVSETGYTGAFTETSTCASIAAVSTASAAGPQATFAAAPAAGGTCVITFTDATNQTAGVAVAVTTSALNVTSAERGTAVPGEN